MMPKKKGSKNKGSKLDPKDKIVKLEVKPFQLSFKDNLKKKITYFKSNESFKYKKIDKDDEDKLKDCLKELENTITNYENSHANELGGQTEDDKGSKKDNVKRSKRIELIKKEIVFGFNEIIKKLRENKIIGIILASQLTTHVQQTVLELACSQKVPVLILSNLEFFQFFFKISRISCFALSINTQSEKSIFNEFNRLFFKINEKFKNNEKEVFKNSPNLLNDDEDSLDDEKNLEKGEESNKKLSDQMSSDQQTKEISKEILTNKSKRLKINHIPIDLLWMPKRDPKKNNILEIKTSSELKKSDDLLLIANKREDQYFPNRMYI